MQGHAPKSGANASGGNQNPTVAQDAHELLREFEEIMVGRGPFAQQEAALKDRSMYGSLRARDFDYSNCTNPTPSYRSYPGDYPYNLFISNPGQSEEDAAVLNSTLLCVDPLVDAEDDDLPTTRKRSREELKRKAAPSIEESDGSKKRHNVYEETMFRIEDERFELDMAI
jgi:histone deacetylase complex regulatory component SIN3